MSSYIIRKYRLSDAVLLAHVGKLLQTLPLDLSTFESNFPIINQAFIDGLAADYEAALAEGGDDVARAQVGQLTQALLEEMNGSKRIVKQLRFWVGEAFANDPARQRSFNFTTFWKVADNQPKLVQFMNALNTVASANSAQLQAAGTPQSLLDDLEANAAALAEADAQQESSKGGRQNATQARILAMNEIYARVTRLDKIADIIFEDNPAKREFYSLSVAAPKVEEIEPEEGIEEYPLE